jgi:hypothetical protein
MDGGLAVMDSGTLDLFPKDEGTPWPVATRIETIVRSNRVDSGPGGRLSSAGS